MPYYILEVTRFICHGPLALLTIAGMSRFEFALEHAAVLTAPPLSRLVLAADGLAAIGATILFGYNLLAWTSSLWIESPRVILAIGIIDWTLWTTLLVALIMQADFIGLTNAQCAQALPNNTIGSGSDKMVVFFERLAQVSNSSYGTGSEQCHEYLIGWYLNLTVVLIFIFPATVCLLVGAAGVLEEPRDVDSLWNYSSILSKLPGTLSIDLELCLYNLPGIIPRIVRKMLYYYWRRMRIWWHYKSPSKAKPASQDFGPPQTAVAARPPAACESRLGYLLGQWPIQESIAANLHYIDLMQLGRVSRQIREIIFPHALHTTDKQPRNVHAAGSGHLLQRYSCGGSSTACWGCGIQICRVCCYGKYMLDSHVHCHRDICRAHCTKCYYRQALRVEHLRAASLFRGFRCGCSDGRHRRLPGPQSSMRLDPYHMLNCSGGKQLLCSECFHTAPTSDAPAKVRERRDKAAYDSLCTGPLTCCACAAPLPENGARWWVCSKCNRECRVTGAHPNWVVVGSLRNIKERTL